MAPALIRYSTSRLASIPARPRPCCPTTWATDAWCANFPPKRRMNSARSESWKYCSRNYGGSQRRYHDLEDAPPKVRAEDTVADHRISSESSAVKSESRPQAGQAPWGGCEDPGALCVTHLGTGLTVVGCARAHILCCQVVSLPDHGWGHPQVQANSSCHLWLWALP